MNDKTIARLLVAAVMLSIGVAAFIFASRFRQTAPEIDYEAVGAALAPATFAEIDGWRLDAAAETLPVLLRSCEMLLAAPDDAPANPKERLGEGNEDGATIAGAVGDWRPACEAAAEVLTQPFTDAHARSSAARAFYEMHFFPVRMRARMAPVAGPPSPSRIDDKGRFTGYFEPTYPASPSRTPEFSAPLYARPDDLVMVDLGRFRPDFAGQRIAGRVADGALDPYPTHADINAGALAGKARVLAWMRPSDLLFLQIQGSGRLTTAQGELRVGYDGANGRPYKAIGKTLIEMGALTRETVSMQTIMAWLDAARPSEARKVRESNESFVFFRALDDLADASLGPLGAQGAQLTPGRSLAVDPRYAPLGAPVWISIDGEEGKPPLRRLLIAQDVGGAIKGPVRGDIFFGGGPEAGDVAGAFNEMGEMIVLVPKTVASKSGSGRSLRGGA